MTTPASTAPTMSVATDKDSYQVGDTLTLTVTYADANAQASTMTITVNGSDSEGNTVQSQTTVQVVQNVSGQMDISATDNWGGSYTVVSNDGTSTAVLTGVVGSPPQINPL
jgi:hypothetical protein